MKLLKEIGLVGGILACVYGPTYFVDKQIKNSVEAVAIGQKPSEWAFAAVYLPGKADLALDLLMEKIEHSNSPSGLCAYSVLLGLYLNPKRLNEAGIACKNAALRTNNPELVRKFTELIKDPESIKKNIEQYIENH